MESHKTQAQRAQPSHTVRRSLLPPPPCGVKPRAPHPLRSLWQLLPCPWGVARAVGTPPPRSSTRKEDSVATGDGRSPDVIEIILSEW